MLVESESSLLSLSCLLLHGLPLDDAVMKRLIVCQNPDAALPTHVACSAAMLPCGHKLCRQCHQMLQDINPHACCPVDDCPVILPNAKTAAEDEVSRTFRHVFQQLCRHHGQGCKAVWRYSDKDTDMLQHREACVYQERVCSNCHEKVMQGENLRGLEEHAAVCKFNAEGKFGDTRTASSVSAVCVRVCWSGCVSVCAAVMVEVGDSRASAQPGSAARPQPRGSVTYLT